MEYKRLKYIDVAKGLLMILVVTEHIFYEGLIRNLICSFHMPSFFIISGVLIRYTNRIDHPFLKVMKKNARTFNVSILCRGNSFIYY